MKIVRTEKPSTPIKPIVLTKLNKLSIEVVKKIENTTNHEKER
jgi:hypothetical protein